jgi:hypothetical protein
MNYQQSSVGTQADKGQGKQRTASKGQQAKDIKQSTAAAEGQQAV